ncbi:peptidyl-prolyl cis-trans isomerase [Trinickia violacea]|uniref:peptidylprolyl isomerase n=1 Tax=Trinickia violacea TaxID=2571746 RepID=A0A4P8J3F1_9BURK|nr:peptidyl-prolyl cis-trans isomerase [Trinickia violacea]QCP55025.1 peptidyl-prolyl cis-trans isomerase [Trinickia violacea]
MLRNSTFIRALCVSAFASVVLATLVPHIVHAAGDSASGPVVALPSGVVAIVNGVAIPQAQLDAAVQASHQSDTPQLRQNLKQQLIVRELFRQNAEKGQYGTKPEVQEAMNAAKVNAETQLYLKDSIHPAQVTDAQVKARYDEIVASLGKEEYKPRIIVVPDEATANTVLAALKSGTAFDALARQYSTAPSKASGGELPWVSFKTPMTEGKTQGLPLAVAQAITQLPVGGVLPQSIALGSDTNGPRAIVKVDAKRPTQVPPFDQAQGTIRQQLQALALEKAAAQFSADLLKGATIQQ